MLEKMKSRFVSEIDKLGGASKVAMSLGVARATVYNWCSLGNAPMDKLLLLSELGLDVSFIFTGVRTISTLDDGERLLLNHYRAASDTLKHAALGVLLSAQQPPPTSVKQKAKASGVVQIGGNNTGTVSNEPKGRKRK